MYKLDILDILLDIILKPRLEHILKAPEPSNSHYRSMPYRPDDVEIASVFTAINDDIFGGILQQPKIRLSRVKKTWGWCQGDYEIRDGQHWPSIKEIIVYPMYPGIHMFVAILGHEMVHQWQWTVNSIERLAMGKTPLMSHGPSFYQWRKAFEKRGLPLARNI